MGSSEYFQGYLGTYLVTACYPPASLPDLLPRLCTGQQPAHTSFPAASCCTTQPGTQAQSWTGVGSKQHAGLWMIVLRSGHMLISTSCAVYGKRLFWQWGRISAGKSNLQNSQELIWRLLKTTVSIQVKRSEYSPRSLGERHINIVWFLTLYFFSPPYLDHSPVSSSFHGLHFPMLVCLHVFMFLMCLWKKQRQSHVVLVFNKAQHQITLDYGPFSVSFCKQAHIIRFKSTLLCNQEWFLVCTGTRTYQWSSVKYLSDRKVSISLTCSP